MSLRSLACAAVVSAASVALLASAADGGDRVGPGPANVVAAALVADAPPSTDDPRWTCRTFSLDLTKGDAYVTVRVRGAEEAFTDVGIKVTRPEVQVVRNGRKTTVRGEPEMVAQTVDPPRGTTVAGRGFALLHGGRVSGAKDGARGRSLWVVTTDPGATSEETAHPRLGCVEMVLSKAGAVETFRVWRPAPVVEAAATEPAGSEGATDVARTDGAVTPPDTRPAPPEPEVFEDR